MYTHKGVERNNPPALYARTEWTCTAGWVGPWGWLRSDDS